MTDEIATTYSDVSIYHIDSLEPFSEYSLAGEFEEILNIEVNSTGAVVVYQITGNIDGDPWKKIVTINDKIVTSYFCQ